MTLIKIDIPRGKRIKRAEEVRKRIRKLKEAHARQPLTCYAKEMRELQEEARLKDSEFSEIHKR